MDSVWGAAKKAGDLVKFGGGFYAGRIPVGPKKEAKPETSNSGFLQSALLIIYSLLGK